MMKTFNMSYKGVAMKETSVFYDGKNRLFVYTLMDNEELPKEKLFKFEELENQLITIFSSNNNIKYDQAAASIPLRLNKVFLDDSIEFAEAIINSNFIDFLNQNRNVTPFVKYICDNAFYIINAGDELIEEFLHIKGLKFILSDYTFGIVLPRILNSFRFNENYQKVSFLDIFIKDFIDYFYDFTKFKLIVDEELFGSFASY